MNVATWQQPPPMIHPHPLRGCQRRSTRPVTAAGCRVPVPRSMLAFCTIPLRMPQASRRQHPPLRLSAQSRGTAAAFPDSRQQCDGRYAVETSFCWHCRCRKDGHGTWQIPAARVLSRLRLCVANAVLDRMNCSRAMYLFENDQ